MIEHVSIASSDLGAQIMDHNFSQIYFCNKKMVLRYFDVLLYFTFNVKNGKNNDIMEYRNIWQPSSYDKNWICIMKKEEYIVLDK